MNPDFLLSLAEWDTSSLGTTVGEENVVVFAVYFVLIILGLGVDLFLLTRLGAARRAWPACASRIEWRPWAWREASRVAGMALLAFVVALAALLALNGVAQGFLQRQPTLAIALQSALIHWPVLVYLGYRLSRRGLTWRDAFWTRGRSWWRDIGWGAMLYVGILPVIAITSWLYHLLLYRIGYDTALQDVALALTDEASLLVRSYLFLLTVLIAPLFEELLFRGIALPALAKRWGVVRAVLIVSVGFALVHQHVPSFVALTLLSAALCLAYIRTGSIIVPTVMHGLFNAVNLGLLLYMRSAK